MDRPGWWLRRMARGGWVVVPDALDQPIALVDAPDLSGWLVEMAATACPPHGQARPGLDPDREAALLAGRGVDGVR